MNTQGFCLLSLGPVALSFWPPLLCSHANSLHQLLCARALLQSAASPLTRLPSLGFLRARTSCPDSPNDETKAQQGENTFPGTHRKAGFHPCSYSPSSETLTAKGSTCQAAWELEVQIQDLPNPNPYSNQMILASVIVGHAEVFEHHYKLLSVSPSMTLFNPQVKKGQHHYPVPCRAGLSSMLRLSLTIATSLPTRPLVVA